MSRRAIIILMGILIVLILVSGYAGSLNTGATVTQADNANSGPMTEKPVSQAIAGDAAPLHNIPAGQASLGNAVGHTVQQ